VLTPTGVGTLAAEGKRTVEIDGRTFLLELPLKADFALINARRADYLGNLEYSLTSRNFNPVMAMAASTVVAEVDDVVPVGVIPPDAVMTPHVLIDYLVCKERAMDDKDLIARRVALELSDGQLVNLGIGLPTQVAHHLPRGVNVFFQSENGLIACCRCPKKASPGPT